MVQDASTADMAVIGTGPAGLAAAWRLREAGHQVKLFERNPQLGGRIRTLRRDGFQMEDGPSQIAGSYTRFLSIMRESGIADHLIPASSTLAMLDRNATSHDFRVEKIHLDMARTKIISLREKLDLAKIVIDVLKHRGKLDPEGLWKMAEIDHLSAEQYGRQRLGDGVYENFVDPVIRGFVGGAPSDVSACDMLFVFAMFMNRQKFFAIREGMQFYADHLGTFFEQQLNAEVMGVDEHPQDVDVIWRDGQGVDRTETFAGVVIATLPKGAAQIHHGLDDWRREWLANHVNNATIVEAHVAMDTPPASKASMVYSTAVSTHTKVIAVNLEHNKAPGRTPEGKAAATIFGSSAWSKQVIEDDDDELVIKELIESAEPMVPGISDDIRFTHLTRWPYSWFISYPGYWTGMRKFTRITRDTDRRVQLAGDYFATTSLNTATVSGDRAARQLLAVNRH